jgi:hypothetical protein
MTPIEPRRVMSKMTPIEQRRVMSKKAWADAFKRLFILAGPDWPVGTNLLMPEIDAAEKAANLATEEYIQHGTPVSGNAIADWEELMVKAIKAAKVAAKEKRAGIAKRGCDNCGVEKVVEVVDELGNRSCAECRRGKPLG